MKQEGETKFTWWQLVRSYWYFVEGHKVGFIFWATLLFIVYFYGLVPPLIVGKIVDFFVSYRAGQPLTSFYFYVLFLGISSGLVAIVRLYSKNRIAYISIDTKYQARVKGFERLIDFSLKWHDKENTGNKAQRIETGTQALRRGFSLLQNDLSNIVTSVVGVFLVFIFLKPIYAVLVIFYVFVFLFIQTYFYKKIKRLNDEKYAAIEKASGTYYEGLSNVLTIKTLGAQSTFKKSIVDKEFISKTYDSKLTTLGNLKWQIFQVFNGLSFIVFLFVTGQNVVSGAISVGTILVIFNYLSNLTDSAGTSMHAFDDLVDIKSAVARMMPIYWQDQEKEHGTLAFPTQWNHLSITNGSFDYKDIPDSNSSKNGAIQNVSLKVERNRKIGIVGKSGSGKSTLAKLLVGLYKLDQGEYRVGKTNFYDIKHGEVTHHMTLVLQDSEMFNLSLKENITLLRNIESDIFKTAIKIAQLEELIEKLPDGLGTLIGEKGYRLSGGERQRVGLARAICKNPQILILDEATSSLDSKTESLVQAGLERYLQGKTMIIIAHRVSTLRNVDKVYVFEAGQIVEEGSYKALLENPASKFNEVYKNQSN